MFLVLIFSSTLASAASCPDLSGDYICPAFGSEQPASPLNVDQKTWRGITEYTYTFENLHPPGKPRDDLVYKSKASLDGETDEEGMIYRCEGRRLSIYNPKNSKSVQQHFREDRTGDYVVVYVSRDGSGTPKEVQRCISQF